VSNTLSIAAVTLTLRQLLSPSANGNVTIMPLDQARAAASNDQLNLFLYETTLNAAWRNRPVPWQARPGEAGQPPLPLSLHYLLTAYGENESDAHRVLGRALSLLHDHSVLGEAEIHGATESDLPQADLHRQPERLRITLLQLSVEEMSKLWSGFQTNYRLSVAVEVSTVLIDSTIPARAALPVLTQGARDRGPLVRGSLSATLTAVVYADDQIAAPLGKLVTLEGRNLAGADTVVRFENRALKTLIELVPEPGATAEALQVRIPSGAQASADWVAGHHSVSVVTRAPGTTAWASNEVGVAIAPTVTVAPPTGAAGDTLTATCVPRIREGQETVVFVGDHRAPATVSAPADTTLPTTISFKLPAIAPGAYVVRVRVDGVDSIASRVAGSPPRLEFDPALRVTIT